MCLKELTVIEYKIHAFQVRANTVHAVNSIQHTTMYVLVRLDIQVLTVTA